MHTSFSVHQQQVQVHIKILADKFPKKNQPQLQHVATYKISLLERCLHYPATPSETRPCLQHACICIWEAQASPPTLGKLISGGKNRVLYKDNMGEWEKYFLVLHDNNFSIFFMFIFFCEFHNPKSQLLKYLWETEENCLFFWQPPSSAYYFQSPEGCSR